MKCRYRPVLAALLATGYGLASVGCLAQTASGGAWTLAASSSVDNNNCDTSVVSAMTQQQAAQIDAAASLSNSLRTTLPSQGIGGLGCLNSLFSGDGLSAIFQPPSLSSIENALKNAACDEVQSLRGQAMQPILNAEGQLGQAGSLPLGQIAPGINLGSVPVGFQLANGNGVQSNLGQVLAGTPADTSGLFRGIFQ